MVRRAFGSFSIVALLICAALVGGAASASAAVVNNGDFETGTLDGWTAAVQTPGGAGWFAYSRKEAEEAGTIALPPSGNYAAAALTPKGSVDTSYLYQDVALPAASTDQLSMYLYYDSGAPFAAPTPNTLFVSESKAAQANQQIRVDVIKTNAPVESLSPNDVLTTVYASKASDPLELGPTQVSADLSAFAGQTVRLRIAAASQGGGLLLGVDGISIAGTPIPQPAPQSTPLPSNEFSKGKLTLNRKNGTGVLTVNLPGAGSLTASDARRALAIASAGRRKGKPKPILIKTKTLQVGAGGLVRVPIQPTPVGRRLLMERGKVAFKVELTFAPTGGFPATQGYAGKLVKGLRPAPR
jgi:hypothetical protein